LADRLLETGAVEIHLRMPADQLKALGLQGWKRSTAHRLPDFGAAADSDTRCCR
jgi:hypothetical protein